MIDKDQLVNDLHLEKYSAEEQDAIFEDFTYEVGAAISDGLSEAQIEEFTQIINANEDVFTNWLATHAPDYREDATFQALQDGYDEDPEKVSPEKVFASAGWVRVNRPDFEQIVTRTKREFKARLDEQASAK